MIYNKRPDYKYCIGVDLSDHICQVSFVNKKRIRMGADPVQSYNIPVEQPGILSKALEGEKEPLTAFLQNLFQMFGSEIPLSEVDLIVFTCAQMDQAVQDLLQEVMEGLEVPIREFQSESHLRSFYSYLLMADDEQKKASVVLMDGNDEGNLVISRFAMNKRTKPIVCFSETSEEIFDLTWSAKEKDEALAGYFQQKTNEGAVSAVYLTGKLFDSTWMRDSIDLICKGRKAFLGDNLYSKGAVYSALFARGIVPKADKYFYLEEDALAWNISLSCIRKRAEVEKTLLEAGMPWYDADVSMEFLLGEGNEIVLSRTSVREGECKEICVLLEGLPKRPPRTTRLRLHLTMLSKERLHVSVDDLGFGEIYPSTGKRWEQEIELAQQEERIPS